MAIFQQSVFKAGGAAGSLDTHVTMSKVPENEGPQPGGLNSKGALSPRAGAWQSGLSVGSRLPSRPRPSPACHRQVLGLLAGGPAPLFSVSDLHVFSAPCICGQQTHQVNA